MDQPVLALLEVALETIVIDGFVISGGLHGIYVAADFEQFANVTISRNVIENNGPALLQPGGGTFVFFGGGIYSSNATLTLTGNTIRNNNANRGGGLFVASKSDFTITSNLIENNSGYGDHSGGIVLNPLPNSAVGDGTFSHNIIRGNVASKSFSYGYGGGIIISGDALPISTLKPVTLSHNIWTGNSAPSNGGAIFVDDGATAILDHELIYNNSTTSSVSNGGSVWADGFGTGIGSNITIKNSTIANNTSVTQSGNGVLSTLSSRVVVSNSIFWGNTDDFAQDETSTITVTYSDSQEVLPGTGNFQADPLFADPAQGDSECAVPDSQCPAHATVEPAVSAIERRIGRRRGHGLEYGHDQQRE